MAANEPKLRLNILALPNQQRVIVLMLAIVVFGTLLAIGYNTPPPLFFGLAALLFVLSFRQMLVFFEADLRQLGLRLADESFAPLQARVALLAAQLELKRVPLLAIASRDCSPRVVATWKRWYVAIDEERALGFQQALDQPDEGETVDAVLLHELYHLKHGDHLWLEYARALLHLGTRLMLWALLTLIGLVVLLTLLWRSFFTYVTPDIFRSVADSYLPGFGNNAMIAFFGSVEEYNLVAERARTTDFGQVLFNVIANTLPYVLIGALILTIYWQRLLRLREVYADLGAVYVLENTHGLIRAIADLRRAATREEQPRSLLAQLRATWEELDQRLNRFNFPLAERVALLQAPDAINGSAWTYGLTSGLFVLGLNLIMSSTAALMLVGQWPMHFPAITITLLISIYMLTPLVLGRPVMRPLVVACLVAIGLHGGMIVLSLLLLGVLALFSPGTMIAILEASARSVAWYTRINPTPILERENPLTILATATFVNLVQVPIIFLLSVGSLWLITRIARRMLTWYSLPNAKHALFDKIYQLAGLVVIIVVFVLLPPITDLALLRFSFSASFGSPLYWLLALGSLLGAAIFSTYILVLDRRYAGRCPNCGNHVAGPFVLGKYCPDCDTELHSWLGARYIFWSPRARQPREVRK